MELFTALAGFGLGYALGTFKREVDQTPEEEYLDPSDTNTVTYTKIEEEK